MAIKERSFLATNHSTRFIIKGSQLLLQRRVVDYKELSAGRYEFKWQTFEVYKRVPRRVRRKS